jgi:hypothetical protein
VLCTCGARAPNGIRTRAAALKGRSPRPLDDGDRRTSRSTSTVAVGDRASIGETIRHTPVRVDRAWPTPTPTKAICEQRLHRRAGELFT